jgi:hypothetical protein
MMPQGLRRFLQMLVKTGINPPKLEKAKEDLR